MGNHTYSKSEINEHIHEMDRLIVPYNHVKRTTDNYYKIVEYGDIRFCLTNILGSVLMGESSSDPYTAFKEVMESSGRTDSITLITDLLEETALK